MPSRRLIGASVAAVAAALVVGVTAAGVASTPNATPYPRAKIGWSSIPPVANGSPTPSPTASAPTSGATTTTPTTTTPTTTTTAPAAGSSAARIDVGSGFVVLPTEASYWVSSHASDPRAGVLRDKITSKPSALWLTGTESYGNLTEAVKRAQQADGALTLCLYNIPGRDDGIDDPSGVKLNEYKAFIDRVVATIGSTRAVVVVEPDALWFVDRQTPPGTAAYTERMTALNYVVDSFARSAPRSALYLEAGTSSKSVTPTRMAQLLQAAGVARTAGFAVNVSSFGPNGPITQWAQDIRGGLSSLGLSDVHYVVDTSRNGNPSWDYTWCNPDGRKLGFAPGVTTGAATANGLDANLWIKQPGTSDGSCGNGAGSYGGQWLPDVAYAQAT